MSMNSIGSYGPPPSFGPLLGNGAPGAKFGAIAAQLQEETVTEKNGAQVTTIQTPNGPHEIAVTMNGTSLVEAGYADPLAVNQFKSALSQALQAAASASPGSASGTTGSVGSQSSAGAAIYQLINQLGNNDPSTSALLGSWNSMMQSGGDTGAAQSSSLQAFLKSEVPAFESGAINVSA